MKKNLRLAMVFVAFYVTFGGVSEAFAQPPQPPIVGGYQGASRIDRQVVSAARFAVNSQNGKRGDRISLISIERAEKQVVAGINYRLCLKVKRNGKAQEVTAVVYQDLQRRYSLSSWKVKSCSKK